MRVAIFLPQGKTKTNSFRPPNQGERKQKAVTQARHGEGETRGEQSVPALVGCIRAQKKVEHFFIMLR